MIALVLAAGLAASEPGDLLRARPACPSGLAHASDPASLMRPQDWPAAHARKLGDLPRAKAEYAVMRRINGCMVAAPVAFRITPRQ
ncbi:MAG TPA: hypothetical protein VJS38_05555 [Phenylobacterium sp.]|uniref:hypothetical protein n=1 Tax=Phenylobacterium sp. TaxID=1871053 RepID=UPI002B48890E|nr:hypothetical protein [Phenylobacterium sp.]HKR87622.1 hypothetical protein [Phenylobacterium sp.]